MIYYMSIFRLDKHIYSIQVQILKKNFYEKPYKIIYNLFEDILALLAQSDRALDFGSRGSGFKSLAVHHSI